MWIANEVTPFSVSLPGCACNNDSCESPDATSTTKTQPPGEPQPSGTPEHVTEGGHTHENLVRSKLDIFLLFISILTYSLTHLFFVTVTHHAQCRMFWKLVCHISDNQISLNRLLFKNKSLLKGAFSTLTCCCRTGKAFKGDACLNSWTLDNLKCVCFGDTKTLPLLSSSFFRTILQKQSLNVSDKSGLLAYIRLYRLVPICFYERWISCPVCFCKHVEKYKVL